MQQILRLWLVLLALATLTIVGLQPANAWGEDQTGLSRFAVVVGSNQGGAGRVQLRYANSDAKTFAKVLRTLGGVESAHLRLVQDAGREQLLTALEGLRKPMAETRAGSRRVELVLYYSGHSDEQGLLPNGERLGYSELRKLLRDLPVDVRIAILDSCASGALIRAKGGTKRAPFLEDTSTQVTGHAYLTSASADEAAQESDQIGGSFFTHHLVAGLRGAADTSGDRRVTLSEAYQFAFHRTLARTEATQRGPQHANYDFDLVGSGDVVITDLNGSSAALALPAPMVGKVVVREPGGQLVLELDKVAGQAVELGLEPGSYRLVLVQGKKAWQMTVVVPRTGKLELDTNQLKPVELAATRARGDAGAEDPEAEGDDPPVVSPDDPSPTAPTTSMLWSLAPGLATAPSDVIVQHLSIGLGGTVMGANRGVALAVGTNVVRGRNAGFLGAAGLNFIGGDSRGVAGAAGANIVGGVAEGALLSAGANYADDGLRGLAATAGANLINGPGRGVMLAVGANVSGPFRGVQAAAGTNIASGTLRGAQLSAGYNHAEILHGLQWGLVNYAERVHGVQIGLVNLVDHIEEGDAIGLLTFAGNGYRHLELWSSDTSVAGLAYKFGGRHFYTVLLAGVGVGDQPATSIGVGWGGHVELGPLYLDADGSSSLQVTDLSKIGADGPPLTLTQLRLILGVPIKRYFAVFAGVTGNLALAHGDDIRSTSLISEQATWQLSGDSRLAWWPGLVFGLRL